MKDFASSYLKKHNLLIPAVPVPPSENIGFIIVIPVFCEPDLTHALESLWNCKRPACATEVLIVVNSSEDAPDDVVKCNKSTILSANQWIRTHQDDSLRFFILDRRFPPKDAGAGLARKTGMDEAVRRFSEKGKNKGYILSFDADSTCDPDYFTSIEEFVNSHPLTQGFSIYFEHPLTGSEFPVSVYDGITQYELHMRYVNLSLRQSGFPYAFHTVGSCFGVRADVYAAQGGMNHRKGGEDFYFLHKVIPLGHFGEINTTCVRPSPRDSFRVPFGTGPVIRRLVETGNELTTYAPEIFATLRQFIDLVPAFYKSDPEDIESRISMLHESIRDFLEINKAQEALAEIQNNSGSATSFRNRFFSWFNAFRVIKFLNFASTGHFPKQPVTLAAKELLKKMGYNNSGELNAREMLMELRRIERGLRSEVTNFA